MKNSAKLIKCETGQFEGQLNQYLPEYKLVESNIGPTWCMALLVRDESKLGLKNIEKRTRMGL